MLIPEHALGRSTSGCIATLRACQASQIGNSLHCDVSLVQRRQLRAPFRDQTQKQLGGLEGATQVAAAAIAAALQEGLSPEEALRRGIAAAEEEEDEDGEGEELDVSEVRVVPRGGVKGRVLGWLVSSSTARAVGPSQ